jgi:hypothetical protein
MLLLLLVDLHNSSPPVSTFRLSVPLPATELSNPKVRRATVSIFVVVSYAREFHLRASTPNDSDFFTHVGHAWVPTLLASVTQQ